MRALCFAVVSLAASSAFAQLSTFDTGYEGWRVAGPFPTQHISDPDLVTGGEGGWEAGQLRVTDIYGWTWVRAAPNYEGDRSSSLGGTISYDIFLRQTDGVPYPAVMLVGADRTLLYNMPTPAVGAWTHVEIPLTHEGWVVNEYSAGAAATAADMQEVLGDLRAFMVLTEWNTGSDDTSLDNVSFPGDSRCPSDFDGSGFVDTDDFTAYVLAFEAGTDDADVDGSGFVDTDDFTFFVLAFESGC